MRRLWSFLTVLIVLAALGLAQAPQRCMDGQLGGGACTCSAACTCHAAHEHQRKLAATFQAQCCHASTVPPLPPGLFGRQADRGFHYAPGHRAWDAVVPELRRIMPALAPLPRRFAWRPAGPPALTRAAPERPPRPFV